MTTVLDGALTVAATDAAPSSRTRRRRLAPATVIAGVAGVLTVAFLPMYFNAVSLYDDEGSYLVAIQRFLQHGSLYDHTHGSYGPFYFTLSGLIFKVIGNPTPFRGRLVVLGVTALTVMVFAATVLRLTRSVTMSVLCEVATFVVLIPYAGKSPMHPGSMIALLVAVLGYAGTAYAISPRKRWLVAMGFVIGALLMTKINIGVFAAAAIVVAFVLGNRRVPVWMRVLVGISAVTLPFVVTAQLLFQPLTAQFAVLVGISMLAVFVPLEADAIAFPMRALGTIAMAATATALASCVWPLATGTKLGRLLHGVIIQPLGQADHLATPIHSHVEWLWIGLTLGVLCLVSAFRPRDPRSFGVRPRWLVDAALAFAGLAVLGLGLFSGIAAWLPAIVLLPALAWLSQTQRDVRHALRFLVPVAILQLLHVYPVAVAQVSWGLVAMCVPCVIAVWAGLRGLPGWRRTTAIARAGVVGALCLLIVVTSGQWPGKAWNGYLRAEPLALPGARLIRVESARVIELRTLARVVRKNCDTFYSVPGFASLYIYTGLPSPTGQLANFPGTLNEREQRDIASQLRSLGRRGRRVCIVRNENQVSRWLASSYGHGPLGKAVAPYRRRVARRVGVFTVSRYGDAGPRRPSGAVHRRKR